MYVGQRPTFLGSVILSYFEDYLMTNVALEILIQCDTKVELKLYM